MENLALPFVLREGYLDRAKLDESIKFSIGLILCTRRGSLPFEPDYGSDIWEKEFSDLLTANKADIRSNLRNALDKYEKRLYNISVSLVRIDGATPHSVSMAIKVTGNYKEDNEEQKFEASYLLG
ncbi:MAG: GPW/gp25 family protein [candidate division Zixibacteria bacterium]